MTKYELSDDVRHFVEQNIRSIDQLETLLFLHRNADRDWTCQQVNYELKNSPESATLTLSMLTNLGICQQVKRADEAVAYRYCAAEPLATTITSLARVYPSFRITIVDLIYSRAAKIISLSEAFRIKKDGNDNG